MTYTYVDLMCAASMERFSALLSLAPDYDVTDALAILWGQSETEWDQARMLVLTVEAVRRGMPVQSV